MLANDGLGQLVRDLLYLAEGVELRKPRKNRCGARFPHVAVPKEKVRTKVRRLNHARVTERHASKALQHKILSNLYSDAPNPNQQSTHLDHPHGGFGAESGILPRKTIVEISIFG
jgi:hypothetical protein